VAVLQAAALVDAAEVAALGAEGAALEEAALGVEEAALEDPPLD